MELPTTPRTQTKRIPYVPLAEEADRWAAEFAASRSKP